MLLQSTLTENCQCLKSYSTKELECTTINLVPLKISLLGNDDDENCQNLEKCSTRMNTISTYYTGDLWLVKMSKPKESAPLGTHLNQKKREYAPRLTTNAKS